MPGDIASRKAYGTAVKIQIFPASDQGNAFASMNIILIGGCLYGATNVHVIAVRHGSDRFKCA
jgi:hypothetical protein